MGKLLVIGETGIVWLAISQRMRTWRRASKVSTWSRMLLAVRLWLEVGSAIICMLESCSNIFMMQPMRSCSCVTCLYAELPHREHKSLSIANNSSWNPISYTSQRISWHNWTSSKLTALSKKTEFMTISAGLNFGNIAWNRAKISPFHWLVADYTLPKFERLSLLT